VIGGDWVAHPSNTATRRILVTYPLLAAMSEEGSSEPPGIRMNNFILCPMIIIFRMNNSSSFVQWSLFFLCFLPTLAECSCKPKVQVQKVLWSHCKPGINSLSHQQGWSLFNDHVQQDRRHASNIDDLRARSMCVYDFAYLIMKIWPHCNLVLISMMTVICLFVILHIAS
jgi:hypothetical protein